MGTPLGQPSSCSIVLDHPGPLQVELLGAPSRDMNSVTASGHPPMHHLCQELWSLMVLFLGEGLQVVG